MNWQATKERFLRWREDSVDPTTNSRVSRLLLVLVLVYLLVAFFVGLYWSIAPAQFSVTDNAQSMTDGRPPVVGAVTTAALIEVTTVMLEKPGGFLSNDISPPGLWLDDVPSWEYGVLIQVRDLTRALRESFSRSQSQSQEDIDLEKAEPRLNFSSDNWVLPASESEYRSALIYLNGYLERLTDQGSSRSQFYARADNLRYWLTIVQSRLGSLSQRLSASVGKRSINIDLAGDAAAQQSTTAPQELELKTPWLEIDDVFYEARGATWALLHFLRAVEVDFASVLEKKNAVVSLRQIIRELESTQGSLYSPMILNGDGFGFLANHSLVMASYISRANAAIIDLRELLAQG